MPPPQIHSFNLLIFSIHLTIGQIDLTSWSHKFLTTVSRSNDNLMATLNSNCHGLGSALMIDLKNTLFFYESNLFWEEKVLMRMF